jgi:hypothetical protein
VTIRRGVSWGESGPLHDDAPVFEDEASARAHLQSLLDSAGPEGLVEIGLLGGDLHRTLGSPRHTAVDLRTDDARRFPVDVAIAAADGQRLLFVSHLVARTRRRAGWWSGRTVAVMNAAFVGELDLGPRAHPNDGRLDVTDGSLPFGQRRQGRRRARTGTHLPHPDLDTRSVRSVTIDQERGRRPLHLWLDGEYAGTARKVEIRCLPDALTVVV